MVDGSSEGRIRRVAWYRVRPGAQSRVEALVRRFVATVRAAEPATLCRAYRLDDGVSYLHWLEFPDAAAEGCHRTSAYARRFADALGPLCDRPPTIETLEPLEPEPG